MSEPITSLPPPLLWKHFFALSQIPRSSTEEENACQHIIQLAKNNGLEYKRDEAGNLLIRKPGTKGHEDKQTIVLQGHIDMVCEKNRSIDHNFLNDPIILKRDGDWIKADGTTLGADNGIGVAAAMAIMESNELVHGPLEFLFTVDEETGLTGVMELPTNILKGRILLNLDSDEEGVIYNGCAGGKNVELFIEIQTEEVPAGLNPVFIKLTGLSGGHSGTNIHEGRGNAIKLLNRFLHKALPVVEGRLADIEGGNKHNAIPREAYAMVFLPEHSTPKFTELVLEFDKIFKDEHRFIDNKVNISFEETGFDVPDRVFTTEFQKKIINVLYSIPHGVMAMSNGIPGVVETSNNLAIINCGENFTTILTCQRSLIKSQLDNMYETVVACGEMAGAEIKGSCGFPPWQPNPESSLMKRAKKVYKKSFGIEPEVKAIHAGVESGIIGDKYPGMDMISFGVNISGAHSPDEKVEIASVEKFWQFTTELLKDYLKQEDQSGKDTV